MLKNLFSFIANIGNDTDPKPSAELVDGKINYTFRNGIEAYQEELTLDQTFRILQIIDGLDLPKTIDDSIGNFVELLTKENAIVKILGIILTVKNNSDYNSNFSELKNSELQKVFGDFFSLNPTAISWSKNIVQGLTSIRQTQST